MMKRLLLSTAILAVPAAVTMSVTARAASVAPVRDRDVDPSFVKLSSIEVPIIDGSLVEGRLKFDLVINTTESAAAQRLAATLPELRSAAIATGVEFARLHASGLAPVEVEILSKQLNNALRRHSPDIVEVLVVKVSATAA